MRLTQQEILEILAGCTRDSGEGEYIVCPICGETAWGGPLDIVHKDDCWLALRLPRLMARDNFTPKGFYNDEVY